jgi:hypothetical protein
MKRTAEKKSVEGRQNNSTGKKSAEDTKNKVSQLEKTLRAQQSNMKGVQPGHTVRKQSTYQLGHGNVTYLCTTFSKRQARQHRAILVVRP